MFIFRCISPTAPSSGGGARQKASYYYAQYSTTGQLVDHSTLQIVSDEFRNQEIPCFQRQRWIRFAKLFYYVAHAAMMN